MPVTCQMSTDFRIRLNSKFVIKSSLTSRHILICRHSLFLVKYFVVESSLRSHHTFNMSPLYLVKYLAPSLTYNDPFLRHRVKGRTYCVLAACVCVYSKNFVFLSVQLCLQKQSRRPRTSAICKCRRLLHKLITSWYVYSSEGITHYAR